MKALYLSTASVALAFGLSVSAQADDNGAGAASAVDEQTPQSREFTWVESTTESSILTQAKAVFAAARQRAGAEDEREVAVVNMSDNLAASAPGADSDCQRMERPGSRIRGTRCYTPSDGERALNAYQFEQELRQIRDQAAMRVMERSQLERVTLEAPTQPADTGGIR